MSQRVVSRYKGPERASVALPNYLEHRDVAFARHEYEQLLTKRLTIKQRLFVETFLTNGFNGDAAARKVREVMSTSDQARTFLATQIVRDAIAAGIRHMEELRKVRLDHVADELKLLAFSNIADFVDYGSDGEVSIAMPDPADARDAWAAVQEITVETYMEGRGRDAREVKRTKFKMHSKLAALKQLTDVVNVLEGRLDLNAPKTVVHNTAGTIVNGNVDVTSIEIVTIPTGEFIPPPENPYLNSVVMDNLPSTQEID